MKLIIMAGGQGTKLWPYSREDKPKQFQEVVGEKTLFTNTVDELLTAFPPEDIFVATKKKYVNFVKEQASDLLDEHIIAEPDAKKNQGPGTLYATQKVAHKFPDEPFMLIQSDVIRKPVEKYIEMIKECDKVVRETGKFVTGGVRRTYPVMGIDYIELSDKQKLGTSTEFYGVSKFVERLDSFAETKDLIENFHVVTHSNHYAWFADDLLEATKEIRPSWYEKINEIKTYFGTDEEDVMTEKLYSEIENPGNIEEVTAPLFPEKGLMALLPFKWVDVGTWGSVYEYATNGSGNHTDGDVVIIDSDKTLLKGKKGKIIAALGVDNIVVVDTEDALLIINKDRTGDVKQVLKNLEESGRTEYL